MLRKSAKLERGPTGLKVPTENNGIKEVEEGLPPILPGIDIEEALRRLGGKKKLFTKLLKAFSIESANAAEEIQSAIKGQNMEVAHRLVHTLKGSAGNISAKELQAAVQELEMAIKEGNSRRYNRLLGNIGKALSQVLESVWALNLVKDGSSPPNVTRS